MSKVPVEVILDVEQAKAQQAELRAENEEIAQATEENKKRTKEAFDSSMQAMRASYMMISGITQVVGGSMGQAFAAIYGVAVSAISTYQSIAAAMAASGVGAFQAALMTVSLISAITSLAGVMTGQTELSRRVSGINMSLQGLSGLIGARGNRW